MPVRFGASQNVTGITLVENEKIRSTTVKQHNKIHSYISIMILKISTRQTQTYI